MAALLGVMGGTLELVGADVVYVYLNRGFEGPFGGLDRCQDGG